MVFKFTLRKMIPLYLVTTILCSLLLHAGNKAVTAMVEQSPIPSRTSIIIDAGHGGIDGGAVSCTGKLESEINLQIATRLNDLLHFMGYETKMLRVDDSSLHTEGETIAQKKISDLKYRVNTVNDAENAVLISIHQNSFSDKRYSGAQVFYSPNEKGKQLAEQLQSAMVHVLNPGSNRKAKAASGIYLMEHIKCKGILIECGFLTNPEEEKKLCTAEYQKQICSVVACVVGTYLNEAQ